MSKSEFISIKKWSDDDKPREKLIEKGKQALSNSELLAILLSTGTKDKSALDLAKELLELANNDLNHLAKLNIKELCEVNGIGPAKAITVIAAIELAGRREMNIAKENKFIKSSNDAYNLIKNQLMDLNHEEFWILLLNRANEVLAKINVSKGGTAGTVVDGKIIMKHAIEMPRCCGIVLGHNHPSGNLRPSEADIKITHKLKEIASFIDINLIDHIIVGENAYYSFADEGILR